MKIYVLITGDGTVSGVFSNTDNMIAELTTSLSATAIKNVEIWDLDKGFVKYLNISKTTTVTIEN